MHQHMTLPLPNPSNAYNDESSWRTSAGPSDYATTPEYTTKRSLPEPQAVPLSSMPRVMDRLESPEPFRTSPHIAGRRERTFRHKSMHLSTPQADRQAETDIVSDQLYAPTSEPGKSELDSHFMRVGRPLKRLRASLSPAPSCPESLYEIRTLPPLIMTPRTAPRYAYDSDPGQMRRISTSGLYYGPLPAMRSARPSWRRSLSSNEYTEYSDQLSPSSSMSDSISPRDAPSVYGHGYDSRATMPRIALPRSYSSDTRRARSGSGFVPGHYSSRHHHFPNRSDHASSNNGADKYTCLTCDKAFSRPSSLKIHMHSHTGEKPFKCARAGCGKAFSVRSNMKRHERNCQPSNLAAYSRE